MKLATLLVPAEHLDTPCLPSKVVCRIPDPLPQIQEMGVSTLLVPAEHLDTPYLPSNVVCRIPDPPRQIQPR